MLGVALGLKNPGFKTSEPGGLYWVLGFLGLNPGFLKRPNLMGFRGFHEF